MKLILSYVKRHLGMYIAAVSFLALETIAELLLPAFMASIVDVGIMGKDISQILRYGAIMLAIALAGAVGAIMRNVLSSRTSQLIGFELRGDIYKKVMSLSFENIDNVKPAAIITRITNDVTQIIQFSQGIMRMILKTPITCIGAIALLIIQTPRQFPVMAAILAISSLLIYSNMKIGYPRYSILQSKLDRLNTVSREFLANIRVVKAFSAEEIESAKFQDAAAGLSQSSVRATRVLAVFGPLINLTVNFGIILLLYLSRSQNASEIGRLMASINYMTQVLFSLGNISNILNNAVRATASANRIKEIFSENPAQQDGALVGGEAFDGTVSFENASFTYSGASRPAVENITFRAEQGESIGIIGSTGSGKTTLVSLVPRFYDASEGRVVVSGHDAAETNMDFLRRHIAIVPQKALLFTGTIEENLRFGNPSATGGDIKDAAMAASAHDFIESFPQGYNSMLGQGGVNLSGGQKQRLCIARALISNPKILILDDCTSALDATTESVVLNAIRSESKEATVLIISQRISTVMRCEKILVMEDGLMKGFGTHSQLMESCSLYQAIYSSQIGGKAYV